MQTQATNSTSKPMSGEDAGLQPTKPKPIRLRPWEIAELLICKRGEQFVNAEFATDAEFGAWIEFNGIPIEENEVTGWNFDDRCMVINHVLKQGGSLEFAGGSTLPETKSVNSEINNQEGA